MYSCNQFLWIVEAGIKNLVRLGSRTKSEKIKQFNLEEISRSRANSQQEKRLLRNAFIELEETQAKVEKIERKLTVKWPSFEDMESYLYINCPEIHYIFTKHETIDPDDFQKVTSDHPFERWRLSKGM